jgi:hypothetical protein
MISTSSLEAATGDSGFAFENPIELLYIADMLYAALTFDKSLILTIRLKRLLHFCAASFHSRFMALHVNLSL